MRFFCITFAFLAATAAANDCGYFYENPDTGGNGFDHSIQADGHCTNLRTDGEQPTDTMEYKFWVKSQCTDCMIFQ
jgi:hypothetical protein